MGLDVLKKTFLIILCVLSVYTFSASEVTASQDPIEIRQLNKNVIHLYRSKKFKEAIPMAQKALRLMNRVEKPSPQLIVQTLNNLAELNRRTGDFVTAETLLLRSLKISVHFLGATHSSVPVICNNLALLYENFGKYSEAEALYQHSLKIRTKKLGAKHPKVIVLVHKLAALMKKRTQQNM